MKLRPILLNTNIESLHGQRTVIVPLDVDGEGFSFELNGDLHGHFGAPNPTFSDMDFASDEIHEYLRIGKAQTDTMVFH